MEPYTDKHGNYWEWDKTAYVCKHRVDSAVPETIDIFARLITPVEQLLIDKGILTKNEIIDAKIGGKDV